MVSMVPPMRTFVVSDAAAIKYIVNERQRFMKPLAIYAALGMFGMNVGITEGKEWTRHRKIVAGPAFAEVRRRPARTVCPASEVEHSRPTRWRGTRRC
jgi:cytochrome P450